MDQNLSSCNKSGGPANDALWFGLLTTSSFNRQEGRSNGGSKGNSTWPG